MTAPVIINAQVLGAERVAAHLLGAGPKVRVKVRAQVNRLGLELLTKVKAQKLTGQVLNVRSGRLRRSITMRMDDQGDMFQARVGTNVAYGRYWEKGFQGVQQVREHLRKVTQAWGRPITPTTATVHTHSRNVDVKARPFLTPSLDEMRAEIRTRLLSAIYEAIQ